MTTSNDTALCQLTPCLHLNVLAELLPQHRAEVGQLAADLLFAWRRWGQKRRDAAFAERVGMLEAQRAEIWATIHAALGAAREARAVVDEPELLGRIRRTLVGIRGIIRNNPYPGWLTPDVVSAHAGHLDRLPGHDELEALSGELAWAAERRAGGDDDDGERRPARWFAKAKLNGQSMVSAEQLRKDVERGRLNKSRKVGNEWHHDSREVMTLHPEAAGAVRCLLEKELPNPDKA